MSPTSKVNTRALAHELLSAIEYRGSDASGFSYVKGNERGVYKNAVAGSQLPLTELPRRAETVILHTRYATQGSPQDNRNNHPVLSPGGDIALVHNGVISNDYEFRETMGGRFAGLPAVDSSVIPALIESDGLRAAVGQLEGYAAVAYIDARDKVSATLNLARLDYSPVAFTWLIDGSFVFASTKALLSAALYMMRLDHGHIFEMPDETYMRIVGGVIMHSDDGYTMQEDVWTRNRYANTTSGGHGTGSEEASEYSDYSGIGSSFGNVVLDDNLDDADTPGYIWNPTTKTYDKIDDTWESDYRSRKVSFDEDEIAMAMAPETNVRTKVWTADAKGVLVPGNPDTDLQGFYLRTEDGSLEFFDTIEDVEKGLDWLSGLAMWDGCPFPEAEQKLRWTNFVVDMGQITVSGGMESWLQDMAPLDEYESPAVHNLQYVRDGLSSIITHVSV